MRPVYRVQFTLEGRPLHIRRDRIISIGVALQLGKAVLDENEQPVANAEETDWVREDPYEQVMVFVEGLGNLPLDESLDEALRIWDGILAAPEDDD